MRRFPYCDEIVITVSNRFVSDHLSSLPFNKIYVGHKFNFINTQIFLWSVSLAPRFTFYFPTINITNLYKLLTLSLYFLFKRLLSPISSSSPPCNFFPPFLFFSLCVSLSFNVFVFIIYMSSNSVV